MADDRIESERTSSVTHRVKSFFTSELSDAAVFTVCLGISLFAIVRLFAS